MYSIKCFTPNLYWYSVPSPTAAWRRGVQVDAHSGRGYGSDSAAGQSPAPTDSGQGDAAIAPSHPEGHAAFASDMVSENPYGPPSGWAICGVSLGGDPEAIDVEVTGQ